MHGALEQSKTLKGISFFLLSDDLPKRIGDERRRQVNKLKEA